MRFPRGRGLIWAISAGKSAPPLSLENHVDILGELAASWRSAEWLGDGGHLPTIQEALQWS